MDRERIVIVEGAPGTRLRVVSRGVDRETDEPIDFFKGEIDGTGRLRIPVPILHVVVVPEGSGAIPVKFAADEFEKTVTLAPG
jgi:hypothetical protein